MTQQICNLRLFANFVSIGLFCHFLAAKKKNFAIFWTSALWDGANWQHTDNAKCDCNTTNLSLFKVVSVGYSNVFKAKSCPQILSFTSVMGGQTENSTFLVAMATCKIQGAPSMTWWYGTSSTFLCLKKHLQIWCRVMLTGTLKICGKPNNIKLKLPYLPEWFYPNFKSGGIFKLATNFANFVKSCKVYTLWGIHIPKS